MRRLALSAAALAVSAAACGALFDNSVGGPATAYLGGSSPDYTSLAAAASGFNAVSGSINRPWRLEVSSGTYTESTNFGFGNTFGSGGSLTIQPAAGATVVFDFTDAGSGGPWTDRWLGHLLFGATTPNASASASNTFASSGKYVIDGSNSAGGTSRDLTFQAGQSVAFASVFKHLVRVVGDNDGVVIRNCNIKFAYTANAGAPLGWASGNVTALGDVAPDDGVVQNCYLLANGGAAFAAGFTAKNIIGSLASGTAIDNLEIRGNLIEFKQFGADLGPVRSATIRGNRMIQTGTGASYAHAVIQHTSANSATGWSQKWCNNDVSITGQTQTGSSVIGFQAAASGGTYDIYNNIIRDVAITALPNQDPVYAGISCESGGSVFNIDHNSFNLPRDSDISALSPLKTAAVRAPVTFESGQLSIRNNIFKCGQTGPSAAVIGISSVTNVTCSGNDLVRNGTPNTGAIMSTNYALLADWQALGFDSAASGGQSTDPSSTSPGAWDATLHFSGGTPSPLRGVTPTIAADFDGDTRRPYAYPGADEGAVAAPVGMSSFVAE